MTALRAAAPAILMTMSALGFITAILMCFLIS